MLKYCGIYCVIIFYKYCHGEVLNLENNFPCKNSLETCLGHVSYIVDNSGLNGIPKSKSDIDVVCKGFKIGMRCLDDYSRQCLTEEQKNLINDHIMGAKYTFKFLCDDIKFQNDYLKYTDCYRVINSDWDECTTKFTSLIRETMYSNYSEEIKVIDLCCAKHGFLSCVYTSSKIKCGLKEAVFIQKIADTLSDNKLVSPVCRHIRLDHCSSSSHIQYTILIITLSLLIIILNNKT